MIVPEAFVGRPDAPVELLSNNPGFKQPASDIDQKEDPTFVTKMRKNLLHEPSDYPLLFLSPEFRGKWWRSKLKEPIAEFGEQVVARNFLNVVYFPYTSRRFGQERLELPSQAYSFQLVADAVKRNAVIVFMRPGKAWLWLEKVSGLEGYARLFRVNNPQMPAISPRNCDGFDVILEAIQSAEAKRTKSPQT